MPASFDPVSFTAISADEFWLLGMAPCKNPVCTSLVRTTDGGAHFVGLPAPVAALDSGSAGPGAPAGAGPGSTAAEVNTVRFADPLDGYVYDSNGRSGLWVTHDGGGHWSQLSLGAGLGVLALATGGGYAFALVATCGRGECSQLALERSPTSSNAWSALDLPLPGGASEGAGLAVSGSSVWLSVSTDAPQQSLLASTDSGGHFTSYPSPCYSGLGGTIEAVSSSTLWSVCPTGTLAGLERSTDGGATWHSLSTGSPLPNSALLAPASPATAVLAPAGQGQLIRTGDGGATWQAVKGPVPPETWSWAGFTDDLTGSALVTAASAPAGWPWPNGPFPEQLWRTDDGGTSWSGPVTIGS